MSDYCRTESISQNDQIIRVNDLVLPTTKTTLFFKKINEKKSDGFLAVVGQTIFVIDGGEKDDYGVLNYLLGIRQEWLKHNAQLIENEQAKIAVQLIITHAHGDHMPAVFHLVRNPFIRIESVYAPPRAAMADTDRNPALTQHEDWFVLLQEELQRYGHTSAHVIRLNFGDHQTSYEDERCRMELFAPPFDWSNGEGYAQICEENEHMYGGYSETGICNGVLNNNSIWSKLTSNGQVVLFTGDQRDNALAVDHMMQFHGVEHFNCDVLKYIHHGSSRYSRYLYQVTRPAITIFTELKNKIYPETLADAEHYGRFYSTEGKNVILQMDGNAIEVYE